MTIPVGAVLRGLVRTKNVRRHDAVFFAITCMVSLLWLIIAYSLSFGRGPMVNGWWT